MLRVIEWLRRRPLEAWITAGLVAASVLFIFFQLHPELLLADTTAAGGDMGAHVWGPAYLRDELLPHFRLSGWAPAWYDGFPAYQFYMVLPSLLIVILDVVFFLPYNIAFKLVTVAGLLALPVAAWALGRLARLPFPAPAALAVATVAYVFDRSFSIYGGNAASTLAGEFAFSISLAFAVLFLGVVLRGLDTGRSRALAAVLLGLTVLCHIIPAIFAIVGAGVALAMSLEWTRRSAAAVVGTLGGVFLSLRFFNPAITVVLLLAAAAIVVIRRWSERTEILANVTANRLRLWWAASAIAVGGLLSAFWTIPFVMRRGYMTDMGWEKLPNYWQPLFPGHVGDRMAHITRGLSVALGGHPGKVTQVVTQVGSTGPADMTLVITFAILGVATSIAYRRRFGIWLSLTAAVLAFGVVFTPQGRLWNARLLPFWYLCLYLLAALAVVELIQAIAVLVQREREEAPRRVLLAGPLVAALVVGLLVALPLRTLPFFGNTTTDPKTGVTTYHWLLLSTKDQNAVRGWAEWNYKGYERKPAYPEYQQVVGAMDELGQKQGCGRAMWEYSSDLDRFGTPMALMLLPYWTNGCIGSMEGLYFEASATTPYHFINQSELSAAPSRAQRDLPYGGLSVALGVDHMQLMGVKYYMASSDAAIAQANQEPDLTLVKSVEKWRIYEVAHSDVVQPLAYEPAVVKGVAKGGKAWQDMAVSWYLDRSRWGVMPAASGPSAWQRVREGETPLQKKYSKTTVTDVKTGNEQIKFTVNRTGAPILIKTSYFPNWKATNAEGPFRVAPNLMVVVPTDNIVTLNYGRTGVDWAGMLLTVGGIGLVVLLARRRRLRIPPYLPRVRSEPTPPSGPGFDEDVLATVGGGGGDERERW
ncbi:MAG: hypothetical protein JWO68_2755, partial [Actinomycetia bacterium]|nr:hypothetical protein [Actinomycetes bacterium]